MLLAQEPKLLLVDEPVAGMTDAETERDGRAAARTSPRDAFGRRRRARHGFRARPRRQGHVLHEGSVLAEGTLDQVSADRARHRSLSGAMSAMLTRRATLDLHYGAAQALRDVSLDGRSRARSPACSAATASARPRCCARSSASSRSPRGSITFEGADARRPARRTSARALGIALRAAGPRDLPAAHRARKPARPASRR